MNKSYQYNPTLVEILYTFIKLIRDLLSLLSPWLAERFYSFCSKYLPKEETAQKPVISKEIEVKVEAAPRLTPTVPIKKEAKTIIPPEKKPFIIQAETHPYIDRGPSLPEHYGEDRISALARDPHCIFVYWDLKGFKSQGVMNYYKGPKSWFLRVHPFGEDAFHDIPINVDARSWYLWVADDKGYIIDLGFSTQQGEFLPLASSNPVQTPRAGTSQEYAEYWGFIFREVKKVTPEGVTWVSPSGRWYEGWFEAHVPGSPQKKGQDK